MLRAAWGGRGGANSEPSGLAPVPQQPPGHAGACQDVGWGCKCPRGPHQSRPHYPRRVHRQVAKQQRAAGGRIPGAALLAAPPVIVATPPGAPAAVVVAAPAAGAGPVAVGHGCKNATTCSGSALRLNTPPLSVPPSVTDRPACSRIDCCHCAAWHAPCSQLQTGTVSTMVTTEQQHCCRMPAAVTNAPSSSAVTGAASLPPPPLPPPGPPAGPLAMQDKS